jgi:hypothetical protein
METGPNPHSIEFEAEKFEQIISFFEENPTTKNFKVENVSTEIPEDLKTKMEKIGFLEFRNFENYKVFFCGYGAVGKGWGFIYGNFTTEEVKSDITIKYNDEELRLTYLELLKGKWHRFAAE